MSTIDPNYFDGWEQRLSVDRPKKRKWCRCGHIEATHYSDSEGVLFEPGASGGMRIRTTTGPLRCHAKDCKCTKFRRKLFGKNRLKFFFTGKG